MKTTFDLLHRSNPNRGFTEPHGTYPTMREAAIQVADPDAYRQRHRVDREGVTMTETQPVTVVEFPPGTTDEQIVAFQRDWTGGTIACRRKGDPEPVRVTAKWFTAGGSLVECQTRDTVRGPELHLLLAVWSDRPFQLEIDIEPIGGDGA